MAKGAVKGRVDSVAASLADVERIRATLLEMQAEEEQTSRNGPSVAAATDAIDRKVCQSGMRGNGHFKGTKTICAKLPAKTGRCVR